MRQLTLLVWFLAVSMLAFAQDYKKEPALEVSGKSELKISPDLGVLSIQITQIDKEFRQTIVGINTKTKDVTRQLTTIGFKESDIKTTDFQITQNRIYRRDAFIDSGFIAIQNVEVEFNYQKETITKILTEFSKSKTDFKLNFDFKLSDSLKSRVQDQLIQLAVQDAKTKALVLATAAGVKLRKISNITYGLTNYEVMNQMDRGAFKTAGADDAIVGFAPKELTFADSVIMMWEFE